MVQTLNAADMELAARLLVALDSLEYESFTVKRLESMLGSVRTLNKQAVQAAFDTLKEELTDYAAYEAAFQADLFSAALPEIVLRHLPLQTITPQQLYASAMARPFQGRLLREWADNLEGDRMTRLTNAVRQGYLNGDTTEAIARKVRGIVSKHFEDGALEASRRNAMTIARTAVSHVAATARNDFARQNADLIKGKQWLSTLDTRTTPMCIVRDGLEYTLDNEPIGHSVPYLTGPGKIHWCCRSTETFVLRAWDEFGIDVNEWNASTRASMDGQVAPDTTYGDWLERQSAERQEAVLGATRAKLMREGGLTTDRFYNDKGWWLTLDELRERDAMAFRRAGL
ncbi:hypothetical protein V8N76_004569 [Salmonella enterica]